MTETQETSYGVICDVGYSDEHWSKTFSKCLLCNKKGRLLAEYGWIGVRYLHLNKQCRGYFEGSDGYWLWKERVDLDRYDSILKHGEGIIAKDESAQEATGKVCQTCGTSRAVGYYGMWYEGYSAFCKKCHRNWLNSPDYNKWLKSKGMA